MSTVVGTRLPGEILDRFNGNHLEDKVGLAYLLVTSDPDGTPRPCMLSAGEVLAPDDGHLRLALWHSHTAENLSRGASCLFCYVAEGVVLYVRGRPASLGEIEGLDVECFEVEVSSVESDVHPGMPTADTIRFRIEEPSLSEVIREWQDRLSRLAGLARR